MMILIACEFSGIVRDAFAARGHDAWSCDLVDTERPGNHITGDVLDVLGDKWDMMIAHPPCTFLCVTANRWMAEKYRARFPTRVQDRKDAIEFFMRLVNAPIPKIAIENPVGVMSSHYRRPDQYVQPFWFGHPESKKTGLWLKNLPLLIPTQMVEPEYIIGKDGNRYSRTHYVTKGSSNKFFGQDREIVRSITYQGFAEAMAAQWGAV
jgi:hypothetical protein